MTREQLEQESTNSVQNLDRNKEGDEGGLSSTLSSTNLKEMQLKDEEEKASISSGSGEPT